MDAITQAELSVNIFVQGLGAWLQPIMSFFSFLGTEQFFLIVVPLLYWCVDTRIGMRIAIMLIVTNGVKSSLKLALHSPRPYWVDPNVKALVSDSSFGLPSGHAQDAASLWGLAAVLVRKWWMTLIALVVIFMIGLSRIYLGVHFLTDVLGGWAVGLILVLLFRVLDKPVSIWFRKSSLALQLVFAALVGAIIILAGFGIRWALNGWSVPQEWINNAAAQWPDHTINPLDLESFITIGGLSFGMIGGLGLLFRTRSMASVTGSFLQRAGRYLLGILILLALYVGLGQIFPSEPLAVGYVFRVIRYALIGAWVSFGAPWLFIRIKLAQPA